MLKATMAWTPGGHDPTLGAWLVTVGYLAVALMCLRAWRRMREMDRSTATAWLVLATVLLVLGLNKQLDFQTLMIEVGRDYAREQGWLSQRRVVLGVLLLGSAIGAVVVVTWGMRRLSGSGWKIRVAVGAGGMLLVMLFVQAGAFGPLSDGLQRNLVPGSNEAWGMEVSEVIELGILILIARAVGLRQEV